MPYEGGAAYPPECKQRCSLWVLCVQAHLAASPCTGSDIVSGHMCPFLKERRVPPCRLLAGACSPVDGAPGQLRESVFPTLVAWLEGIGPSVEEGCGWPYWRIPQNPWPITLSAEALVVSAELLRCAASNPQLYAAASVHGAIEVGDLRLVGLVLEAFPQSVLLPEAQGSTELSGFVGCACNQLQDRLVELDSSCGSPSEESELESESESPPDKVRCGEA